MRCFSAGRCLSVCLSVLCSVHCVSEMTYYVSTGTLNPTHSLTVSVRLSCTLSVCMSHALSVCLSVCLGRACIVIIRCMLARLDGLWLDSPMFWAPCLSVLLLTKFLWDDRRFSGAIAVHIYHTSVFQGRRSKVKVVESPFMGTLWMWCLFSY